MSARRRIRAIVTAAVVAAAATPASAAPWSFELPAGYTELPGAGDAEIAQLRQGARTVSADAQVYVSPNASVRLTRMTWLSRFDVPPTRGGLESMDKRIASSNGTLGKIVSDSRQIVGEQLVSDQVIAGDALRVRMRRIYAADTERVVHMFTIVCAGPADQLADCEKAQQTMQLVLPNQAPLAGGPGDKLAGEEPGGDKPTAEKSVAYLVGQIALGLLVAAVAFWLVLRRGKRKE